jgi:hypothetical protein
LQRVLKKLSSPQAAGDLNAFVEKLPVRAGQAALVAAGISWGAACAVGLYTSIQVKNLTELRATLEETKALKPMVPKIKDAPIAPTEISAFATSLSRNYPGLSIKQQGPSIEITAKNTGMFGVFREAIGHVQNGGDGWRVSVDKMCVGRECPQNELGILLKINKVTVEKQK